MADPIPADAPPVPEEAPDDAPPPAGDIEPIVSEIRARGRRGAAEMEETLVAIVADVRHAFGSEINVLNLVPIVAKIMELVEGLPKMAGPQKKALAVMAVQRLLGEVPEDAPGRDLVVPVVSMLLPSVVDGLVAAAKGQLSFGAAAASTKKCCTSWFPCCGKAEKN